MTAWSLVFYFLAMLAGVCGFFRVIAGDVWQAIGFGILTAVGLWMSRMALGSRE